jgi:hypothetical protein
MSPLPLKKGLSAFQPIVEVRVSPAGLAQITVTFETINSGGVACAIIGKKKDVPMVKKNAASTLLFLTKKEIDFVNAGFQSIHLVFNGTAPVRSQFIQVMLYQPTNSTSKGCCNCCD